MNIEITGKFVLKIAILVVVVIVFVILLTSMLGHRVVSKTVKSKPSLIELENDLHVFSSPTLSFNFTDNFSLESTAGLLISNNSYNSVRLYYKSNNSVFITVAQYIKNNTSAINYSYIKNLAPKGYYIKNFTFLGYNALSILNNDTRLYQTLIIDGPTNYYTVISLTDLYNLSTLYMNRSISYILETMKFNSSKYIP